MLRWTKVVLSACLAILAFMAQVGPDDAVSNISRWWAWIANPPSWLQRPVIDALWTTVFLALAVVALWFAVRGYFYWRRKLARIKTDPEIRKPRAATENPLVKYAISVKNSEHVSINIAAPLASAKAQAAQNRAFVKFSPAGMVLASSYNISSITDNGLGDYTVNFGTSFSSDDIKVEPVGIPPKSFDVVELTPNSVRVKFDEEQTPVVALEFSARSS